MASILLVDDNEALRLAITAILQRAGHAVVAASNGLEGISLFRSSPNQFDLILTDLQMPVMDGNELVALARETDDRMKIMCMSGGTDKPPADAKFLRKPFDMKTLVECVNRLLYGSERD